MDVLPSAKPNDKAAKRFLKKGLTRLIPNPLGGIAVDKRAAYPPAIDQLTADEALSKSAETRQAQYLNTTVESDNRFVKRRIKPSLGFGSFNSARRTLKGDEAMNMIRQGQIVRY